jgi:hypothetical protein
VPALALDKCSCVFSGKQETEVHAGDFAADQQAPANGASPLAAASLNGTAPENGMGEGESESGRVVVAEASSEERLAAAASETETDDGSVAVQGAILCIPRGSDYFYWLVLLMLQEEQVFSAVLLCSLSVGLCCPDS